MTAADIRPFVEAFTATDNDMVHLWANYKEGCVVSLWVYDNESTKEIYMGWGEARKLMIQLQIAVAHAELCDTGVSDYLS